MPRCRVDDKKCVLLSLAPSSRQPPVGCPTPPAAAAAPQTRSLSLSLTHASLSNSNTRIRYVVDSRSLVYAALLHNNTAQQQSNDAKRRGSKNKKKEGKLMLRSTKSIHLQEEPNRSGPLSPQPLPGYRGGGGGGGGFENGSTRSTIP